MKKLIALVFLLYCSLSYSQSIRSAAKYMVLPSDTILLSGSGFNTTAGSVFVFMGHSRVRSLAITSTQIKLLVPGGITQGRITYIDTVLKKTCKSAFEIKVVSQFAGAKKIDGRNFDQKQKMKLDTNLSGGLGTYLMDLNNDGMEELIMMKRDDRISIYRNLSNVGTVNFQLACDIRTNSVLQVFNDFNYDGRSDMVTTYMDTLFFWTNTSTNGSISFTRSFHREIPFYGLRTEPYGLVDFNGDGRMDICADRIEYLSDTAFYLTKWINGKLNFKPVTPVSALLLINNIIPLNIDSDSLTDLIAFPTALRNATLFYKNISKGDTIRFKLVDSIAQVNYTLLQYIDINRDNKRDLIFVDFNAKKLKVLINNSTKDSFKFKEVKNNSYFSYYRRPQFWDYNGDSIPDIFYSTLDTIYCKTMFFRNDSLILKTTLIEGNGGKLLYNIADVDRNNQPDFICDDKNYPFIHFLLGTAVPLKLVNPLFLYHADSVNQVFYDSVTFTNQSYKTLKIDTIKSTSNLKFYDSRKYITKLAYPIVAVKDSAIKIYFSYKYTQDRTDTLWINNQKYIHLGIISSRYVVPCAKIKSIDKLYARPGDTITIKGNYFFKTISDITVRINNRRCEILGSSKDTVLKVIYPWLTESAKLLITDTAKHYNVYSSQKIQPAFKNDTSAVLDAKSFRSDLMYDYKPAFYGDIQAFANHQRILEAPTGSNHGHVLTQYGCYMGSTKENELVMGKVSLRPYTSAGEFKKCTYTFREEITSFLYGEVENSDLHFTDLNTDGLMDYVYFSLDTFKVLFCEKVTDSSVVYGTAQTVSIEKNPYGINNLVWNSAEYYDLDDDGINEILTISPAGDTIYILNYDFKKNKLVYKDYLKLEANTFIYKIADYTNDGKADLLCIQNGSNNYRYVILENNSKRGEISFSDKEKVLVGSTSSSSLTFYQADFNNDANMDLMFIDYLNMNHRILLADPLDKGNLKLLDSFVFNDYFWRFSDLNGDRNPELIGKEIFRYRISNGRFLISKVNTGSPDLRNLYIIADADGDYKPDLITKERVFFNTSSYAKFRTTDPKVFETDNYGKMVWDSITVYNDGSSAIHLKQLVISDTGFSLYNRNKAKITYPVWIKALDSFKIYISFNPRIRPKKFYGTMLTGYFAEDMPAVYKELRGYVNLAPQIKRVLPDQLIAGDTAAIFGKNFDNLRSRPLVTFANAKAEILTYDDTLMLVRVPFGGVNGYITVYDTTTDLMGLSPRSVHYTFIGTSNNVNINSFKKQRVRKTRNAYSIADSDQDGLPDILTDTGSGNYYDYSVRSKNQSNKNELKFDTSSYYGYYPLYQSVLSKDLDADGTLEHVLYRNGNINGTTTLHFRGNYYGTIYEDKPFGTYGLAFSDLNSNGKIEINFGNGNTKTGIYEHNLKVTNPMTVCDHYESFYEKLIYTEKTKGSPIFSYDFDGDGKAEALYVDTFIKIAFNLSNKDSFHFAKPVKLPDDVFSSYYYYSYTVADMNADGKLDILTNNNDAAGNQWITIYKNTSTVGVLSFVSTKDTFNMGFNIDNLICEDFNGDAKPEMLLYGYPNDSFYIRTNASSVSKFNFKKYTAFKFPGKYAAISTADMNADSKADIIVQTDSGLYIYRNTNISGFLSRNADTFRSSFGFPLSFSLALYSTGGDTLVINKILIPKNYKLVNSSGSLKMSALSGMQTAGLSMPLKISPRDSFPFKIVMDPATKPGKYADTFFFYNNESSEPYRYIIKGEIKPTPLAYTSKSLMEFGKVKMKAARQDTFYIKNIGYDTLKISKILLSDSVRFKVSFLNFKKNIAAGDSMFCLVDFKPTVTGVFSTDLTFQHNDFKQKSVVALKGESVQTLSLVKVSTTQFKSNVYKKAFATLTICNTNNDTLFGVTHQLSNPGNFSIIDSSGYMGYVLPNVCQTFKIEFLPKDTAIVNSVLTVKFSGDTMGYKFNLKGQGLKAIAFMPDSLLLNAAINTVKSKRIVLFNKGNYPLLISKIEHQDSVFSISGTLKSLLPGDSTFMDVTFKPVSYAKWHYDAMRVISYSDTIQMLSSVYLKGRCLYPEIAFSKAGVIAFPDTKTGTYSRDSLLIYNKGDDTLNINISAMSGFEQATGNFNILPGSHKTSALKFSPLKQMTYEDSFFVTGNSVPSKSKFKVIGKGIFNKDNYKLVISKETIDFGFIKVGDVKTDSVELYNSGNDTLIVNLSPVIAPFAKLNTQNPLTLYPSNRKMVQLSFNPTVVNSFTDTLFVSNLSNDIAGAIVLNGNSQNSSNKLLTAPNNIKVYPVPADQVLTVEFENAVTEPVRVSVTDLLGKEIYSEYYKGERFAKFDIRNIQNGVYLLNIFKGNSVYSSKIVVFR